MDNILAVRIGQVTQVLLAGEWHIIKQGSFQVGDVVFVDENKKVIAPSETDHIIAVRWVDRDRAWGADRRT